MTAILNATGPAPLSPPARPPAPSPQQPAAQEPAPQAQPAQAPAVLPSSAQSCPEAGHRSAGQVGPVLVLPGAAPAAVVPVARGGRPVGAFVLAGGRVRYRTLADPDRVLAAATGALAVGLVTAAVAVVASRRRPPAIGTVRMGPGGWVSLRGVRAPALRSTGPRPWWAHVLRAHRLPGSPRR
ncbi:hypothetical protein [Micromonospora carbonacea]|uniref:Uncharacterized protein n=1 Tax=Micromonospora carbonacea TaxID=47853 RepID=A0A1C5ASB7_9ACTN|nr:hypothetical protein [Micromonospora carbonacea]SCF48102.1 hypothetical protein GA0070563_11810 [Micromonospora carbonacea]